MKIEIEKIRTDGGTQSRVEINQAVVEEYAEAIAEGAKFPPVVVFEDGGDYWLADGFHRVAASRAAKRKSVDADVRQGTLRDAVLYSAGANGDHGLRRTNEDKRRAVRVLLDDPEWSRWSDREIARRAGVGPDLVGVVRRSLSANDSENGSSLSVTDSDNQPNRAESLKTASSRTYVTKHGAVARMNTSGIAARNAGRVEQESAEPVIAEPQPAQRAPSTSIAAATFMSPAAARSPEAFRAAQAEFKERIAARDAVHYRVFCTAVRRALEAKPENVAAIRSAFAELDQHVDPFSNGK